LSKKPCVERVGAAEMEKIPKIPMAYRFPYGVCSPESLALLQERNLPAIQWTIVTADSVRGRTARDISATIIKQIEPGAIIVCHANGRGRETARALPLFIPELRRAGYVFVTVTQLLMSGEPRTVPECYELRAGDNKRYDKLFGAGT